MWTGDGLRHNYIISMEHMQKLSLFLLRVSFGWMFLYAGITKILNPEWSAAGYLKGAKTFAGFYQWLAGPQVIPVVNFINEWGLALLGVSLIFGVFVRLSGILGAALMLMYYFPILQFPYPNAHSYIVDEHIIYAAAWVFPRSLSDLLLLHSELQLRN